MEEIEGIIASVIQGSFAIAVAAYMLISMEKRMKALETAIRELTYLLSQHMKEKKE